MTTIAAIDQGTTSTRVLVARAGRAEVVHAVAHGQHYPAPGRVEHDPEELIANIEACLAAAGPIDAIGIDNQGESCLAWDAETKRALSPVIVWQDDRTADVTEALKAGGHEATTLARAGLPLDPYFSASKLGWVLRELPAARAALAAGRLRLGTTDAFFLDRLAGRFQTDVTTASRTSLMNLETGDWDDELCALFGVPRAALPRIVPTVADHGAIEIAGRRVPVTASVVDQQASLYGHGCRSAGDAKVTFGTGAFVLAVTGPVLRRAPDQGLLPTIAWQQAGGAITYALDGGVYTAGSAMDWARRLNLFGDFAQIGRFEGPAAIERGLVFVPALAGLACPHWQREAAGCWLGLTLDTGPLDLVRAVMEGVALRTAEVVHAMAGHVPLGAAISVDGGMARNDYFCAFLATALGRPVIARGAGEMTVLGTAMLAGAGEGLALAGAGPDRRFEPGPEGSARRRLFDRAIALAKDWGRPLPSA